MKSSLFLLCVLSLTLRAAETRGTDEVIVMKPVRAIAEWLTIRPMLQGGVVQYATITSVTRGSPAEAAGIKPGSKLIAVQGRSLRGLTKIGFTRFLDSVEAGVLLELGIIDSSLKGHDSKEVFRMIRLPLTVKALNPEEPNKAPEPTTGPVTTRARGSACEFEWRGGARVAPGPVVAHL